MRRWEVGESGGNRKGRWEEEMMVARIGVESSEVGSEGINM